MSQSNCVFGVDTLEARRLMSVVWGPFPTMDGQLGEVTDHPTINGAGVTIVEIDSGVDVNDPLIGDGAVGPGHRIIYGYNYEDNNTDISDPIGHGTAVAGILVGNPFEYHGQHFQGVAPDANLIVLKQNSSVEIKKALDWCIANRSKYNIQVINMTDFLGASFVPTVYSSEAKTLHDMGVFITTPTGNDGPTNPITYPGADPNIFATAAVDRFDNIESFDQRGPDLDMLGPGFNVTVPYFDPTTQMDIIEPDAQGTSFSAPHISATAALIKQIDPSFTPDQIMAIMKSTGVPLFDSISNMTYPRIDIDAAVTQALAERPNPTPGANATWTSTAFDKFGRLDLAYYNASTGDLMGAIRSVNGAWGPTLTIDTGSVGQYVSLADDSNGYPGVAYFDAADRSLKYAKMGNTKWVTTTVETGGVGYFASLQYNSSNLPAIAYYDNSDGQLHFATYANGWHVTTVDSGRAGYYPSLAHNPLTNTWSIAYTNAQGQFKYAIQTQNGSWKTQIVTQGRLGGAYISLAYDNSGLPEFSYYDGTTHHLNFAHYIGHSWQIDAVAQTDVEGWFSKLIVGSDGLANIFYYNKTLDTLFSATGDVGNWDYSLVTNTGGAYLSAAQSPNGSFTVTALDTPSNALRFFDDQ